MPAPAQNTRPAQAQPKPPGQAVAVAGPQGPLITAMASTYGMDPEGFQATLLKTVMPENCSREEMAAFLVVAREHNLNPFKKEIYAFKGKGGGIVPIVSIDGWITIINRHPAFAGVDFEDHRDADGNLFAITCNIHRSDRASPISITEYMAECARPTEPWKQWPNRFLRHRALIQCGRVAFGIGGILDPDEADGMVDITPTRAAAPAAPPPQQRSAWTDADAARGNREMDSGYADAVDRPERQSNGGENPLPYAQRLREIESAYLEAQTPDALTAVLKANEGHIKQMPDDARASLANTYQRRMAELKARHPAGDLLGGETEIRG